MAIVQKKLGVECSIYEILQIESISLTDTTALKILFGDYLTSTIPKNKLTMMNCYYSKLSIQI